MKVKRILAACITCILLLITVVPTAVEAASDSDYIKRVKQSVVFIVAETQDGSLFAGTGFCVAENFKGTMIFATNHHVVTDDAGNYVPNLGIVLDDGDWHDQSTWIMAEIICADPYGDHALIQIDHPIPGIKQLPLLSPTYHKTGDTVYALGYPGVADLVVDQTHYTAEDITVTNGIISRFTSTEGADCIAHTAKINHGNSGGPLINQFGQVIGTNTFFVLNNGEVDMRPYAYSIDFIRADLEKYGIPYTNDKKIAEPGFFKENGKILVIAAACVLAAAAIVLVVTKKKNGTPAEKPVKSQKAAVSIQEESETVDYNQRPAQNQTCGCQIAAVKGPLTGHSWILKKSLVVGREPGASILFPANAKGVSRVHCRLDLYQGRIFVTDLSSSYGTYVNGHKITPNQPVPVEKNSTICMGSASNELIVR